MPFHGGSTKASRNNFIHLMTEASNPLQGANRESLYGEAKGLVIHLRDSDKCSWFCKLRGLHCVADAPKQLCSSIHLNDRNFHEIYIYILVHKL